MLTLPSGWVVLSKYTFRIAPMTLSRRGLRVDEVAKAVDDEGRVAVHTGQPCGVLYYMRVGADDDIDAWSASH